MTTQIVVAAIERGPVQADSIPALISSVFKALENPTASAEVKAAKPAVLVPAVPIDKSVTPDYVISLENGKHFKAMRSHLRKLGMTPAQYREKWGLPADYPVVAPNYAASRSMMALLNGLGTTANSNAATAKGRKRNAAD